MVMIEQALAAAGQGEGATTIEIPASQFGPDGQILVDGNNINITVEQVALAGRQAFQLQGGSQYAVHRNIRHRT